MVNTLLFLYQLLFNNFTLAILVFTILIRVITFPLTYQQQKSTKKLQDLTGSDEYKRIQEKYAKDREKLSQEQMRLYQQAGVNPFGSCLPTLIQFPVLIGLYQAIVQAMAASPLQLLDLSSHIYKFLPNATALIPLDNQLFWLNLGLPDPFYVLPVLVVATTWLLQKIMTPPTAADAQQAAMAQQMAIMMPLMIGWMSLTLPAGMSVYWIISNVIGAAQYLMTPGIKVDWRGLVRFGPPAPVPARKRK